MFRKIPPVLLPLLLATEIFGGTAARAELVHFKHSSLKKVEDKRVCLTFSHETVETAPKSPTNTTEAIECRVRVWPEILGKVSTQTFDEHDVYQTAWAVYEFGETKELCFDFAQKLLPAERIEDVGRVSIRCATAAKADRVFANAADRPKKGIFNQLISYLWRS